MVSKNQPDKVVQTSSNNLRTLIIGGGIAGLTLAALMEQREENPLVIEKVDSFDELGYMLGLYPLGARVLQGLGLYDRYLEESVTMKRYAIHRGDGSLVKDYDLSEVNERFGPIQGITRGALVRLLLDKVGTSRVRTGVTTQQINQSGEVVHVDFSDGSSGEYDLVVAADGMHSATRKMLCDESSYEYKSTGWGGWVFWADPSLSDLHRYKEFWGAGHFVGLYPAGKKLGVFIGGPVNEIDNIGMKGFIDQIHSTAGQQSPLIDTLLSRLEFNEAPYFWKFHDVRLQNWRKGRVVFLGDAAAGFLPTAGVGASMAMESAAALNDELSRTTPERVEQALDLYIQRHQERVFTAQDSSRQLGQMMFLESPTLSWGRNKLLNFYTVEQLVKDIADLMDQPI